MEKKKILHIVEIVLAILIVIVLISIGIVMYKNSKEEKGITSKVNKLNEKLAGRTEYSFKTTSENENEVYFAKKYDKTYIKTTFLGSTSEYVIKDQTTYLIKRKEESYYTYNNNNADKNKIEDALDELKEIKPTKGREKINKENLKYEEYKKVIPITMLDTSESEEGYTMRFYFKGNDLKYIKTFKENKTEILKVEMEDKVDDKLFEIPSNFKER